MRAHIGRAVLLTACPLATPPRSGLIHIQHLGAGAWGGYTAVFGVIVASAIAMDGWVQPGVWLAAAGRGPRAEATAESQATCRQRAHFEAGLAERLAFARTLLAAPACRRYNYVQLPPPGLVTKVHGSGFPLTKAAQDRGFANLPGGITPDESATPGTVTPATGYGSTVQLVPQA